MVVNEESLEATVDDLESVTLRSPFFWTWSSPSVLIA
jgi:hypothetical protein